MKKTLFYLCSLFAICSVCLFAFSACSLLGGSKDKNNNSGGSKSIEKVDMSTAEINIVDMEYTGEEIVLDDNRLSIRANDRWLDLEDFNVSYSNNINVGTAYVTFTAKETCLFAKGSTTRTFNIIPPYNITDVETIEEVIALLASNNYKKVGFYPKTDTDIPSDTTITVPAGKSLTIKADSDKIHNYGTIESYGSLTFGSGSDFVHFYNVGTINAHGDVIITYARIFNSGIFSSERTIQNRCQVYTDTPLNIETISNGSFSTSEYKVRTVITADKISLFSGNNQLVDNKFEYVENGNTPTAKFEGDSLNFRYEYLQNDRISTDNYKAKVIVAIAEYDQNYGGKVEVEFDIVKGQISFENQTDLLEKQQTGNYNRYTCTRNSLTLSNDFCIAEDETLSAQTITIAQDAMLTNLGTLCPKYDLTVLGMLNSTGNINGEYGRIVGSGTIVLGSASNSLGTFTFSSLKETFTGTLTNYGNLTFTSPSKISCNVSNFGEMSFSSSINMSDSAQVENDGSLTLGMANSTIKCDFEGASLVNRGTVTNNVTTAWNNTNATIETSENGFVNNGTIYCFAPIQNVTTNVIVRKNLQNATCTLNETKFDYDGNEKQIAFYVDGEVLPSTMTVLTFRYPNASSYTTTAIAAGTDIQAILVVKSAEKYCEYYGQASLPFTINKVNCNISNITDFKNNVGNASYSSFTLTNSITVSLLKAESFTIYEDQIFDTNGFQLVISTNATITNYGTLVVDELDTNATLVSPEECALIVSGNSILTLKTGAELQNNDIILVRLANCQFNVDPDVTISGEGQLYTNKRASSIASVAGKIFNREVLNTFEDISLEYANNTTVFDGTNKTPSITAIIGAQEFSNSDFTVIYNNNQSCTRRGTYSVSVSAKTDFDENFVGTATLYFTIESNIKTISSASDWRNTIFDSTHDRYDITASFNVSNGITIPDDVILNFGSYRLSGLASYTLRTGPNTEVWMDISSYEDYVSNCYFATKITLTGDIATDSRNSRALGYDPSSTNLNRYTGPKLTRDESTQKLFLEIDLNGHIVNEGMNIANNSDLALEIFITNSSSKTALVDSINYIDSNTGSTNYNDYALYQNYSKNPLSITISENINISGMLLLGCDSKEFIFNAKGISCTQKSSGSSTSAAISISSNAVNCDINFVDCSFVGKNAAIIRGAKQVFENCTFNSAGTSDGFGVLIQQNKADYGPYIDLTIIGGTITSLHNHGIFVHGRDLTANETPRCSIKTSATISVGSGKQQKAYYRTRDQYVFTTP